MPFLFQRTFVRGSQLQSVFFAALILLAGCASPGVPRSPSLNLPSAVTDLSAVRRGDAVELRFTVPQRNTDRLPLRADALNVALCRAVDGGTCLPLPATESLPRMTQGRPTEAVLRDALPAALTIGAPHELSYRVELFNPSNHTAGFSEPVFTLAGEAPLPVTRFAADGSRLGIVLSWQPVPADDSVVALRREDLDPKPIAMSATQQEERPKTVIPTAAHAKTNDANVVWLGAPQPDLVNKLLDTTAVTGDAYRYTAERRRTVQLGGRTLEMRSVPSAAVIYVLHDVYPPPVPTDLTAAAFAVTPGDPAAGVAVDLIWQPVDDPGLRGYNVYRQAVDAAVATRLNAEPLRMPAFHDKLPGSAGRFRYSVTAIDKNGNESAAATTTVDATP